MKNIFWLLVLTSNLLFAQHNVAFLHPGKSPNSTTKDVEDFALTSPFELVNGLVIVRASIDGKEGDFILDTGAPGIVLNTSPSSQGDNAIKAFSVGGELKLSEIQIRNFQWGGIRKEFLNGLALDIKHLEEACERQLMGLIGFEVVQNFELLFDYKHRLVRMYDATKAERFRPSMPIESLSFQLNGHLPVIMVKVGGKRAFLGLDSGAAVNILDERFFEKMNESHYQNIKEEVVVGLDRATNFVKSAEIEASWVKGIGAQQMRYLFVDLSSLQVRNEVQMDGILGFPFFENHTISINYQKRRVYFWD